VQTSIVFYKSLLSHKNSHQNGGLRVDYAAYLTLQNYSQAFFWLFLLYHRTHNDRNWQKVTFAGSIGTGLPWES